MIWWIDHHYHHHHHLLLLLQDLDLNWFILHELISFIQIIKIIIPVLRYFRRLRLIFHQFGFCFLLWFRILVPHSTAHLHYSSSDENKACQSSCYKETETYFLRYLIIILASQSNQLHIKASQFQVPLKISSCYIHLGSK